ncbi:hypothetical protein MRY82_05110 [bacterium]|nr:hypothetical protein [bacterium]
MNKKYILSILFLFNLLSMPAVFSGPALEWVQQYASTSPFESIRKRTYIKELNQNQLFKLQSSSPSVQYSAKRYQRNGQSFSSMSAQDLNQYVKRYNQDSQIKGWDKTIRQNIEASIREYEPGQGDLTIIVTGTLHGIDFYLNQLVTKSLSDYHIVYAIDYWSEDSLRISRDYKEVIETAGPQELNFFMGASPIFRRFQDPRMRRFRKQDSDAPFVQNLYGMTYYYLNQHESLKNQQNLYDQLYPQESIDQMPDVIIYLDSHNMHLAGFHSKLPSTHQLSMDNVDHVSFLIEGYEARKELYQSDLDILAYFRVNSSTQAGFCKYLQGEYPNGGAPNWVKKICKDARIIKSLRGVKILDWWRKNPDLPVNFYGLATPKFSLED